MEMFSGNNLLHTFHELGIDTGNISENVFDAWYDTDDERTRMFLNWLCCLNKENVLKASEHAEFTYLKENGLILEKTSQTNSRTVKETEIEYEEIWNCDSNIFETEHLSDELSVLTEQQQHQENIIKVHETLSKRLIKQINCEAENELKLTIKNKIEQENCLQLSSYLDELHQKIHDQIQKYSESINNFENIPAFISNVPWEDYNQYCHEVSSNLNHYIRKEQEVNPKYESAIKTPKRCKDNSSFTKLSMENLDDLHTCITKAMQISIINLIEEEKLRAEITYLRNLNVCEVVSFVCNTESLQFILEANIASKEEKLLNIHSQIERIVVKVASRFTNEAKINCIKNHFEICEKKLNHLTDKVSNTFLDILTNQILCFMLLNKEKSFIITTEQFFKDITKYTLQNMQQCQKRIEGMVDVIQKHEQFEQLPVENKTLLVKSAASILSKGKINENFPLINIITDFKQKQSSLNCSIFKNDAMTQFGFIEKQINLLKSFLMSSPTSRKIAIPYELYSTLERVKSNLGSQKDAIFKGVEIYNNGMKVISKNKWFRLRRQLWLLFMSEPKTILDVIEELKKEIEPGSVESTSF